MDNNRNNPTEQNNLSTPARSKLSIASNCPSPTPSDDSNNLGDGDKAAGTNPIDKPDRCCSQLGLNSLFAPQPDKRRASHNNLHVFPSRSTAYPYPEQCLMQTSSSMEELLLSQNQQSIIGKSSFQISSRIRPPTTDANGQILFREMSGPVENEFLVRSVDKERKKCIMTKLALAFVFRALRKRDHNLADIESRLLGKQQECAARLILHHMLLNSWRVAQRDLKDATVENSHLHKTVRVCYEMGYCMLFVPVVKI